MSQYKISKKRLAEIIKEEYEAAINRTDEAHCGSANRDEDSPKSKKKVKNPGPYIDGERAEAGIDDDGDGIPNKADSDPRDGSKKMKKESLDSIRTLIQQELKNL
tara:strand:- start:458 stop:772 length:315 start_codon:yes stop_codon:yes gene_type:complete